MFYYHFPLLALLFLALAGNAARAQEHPEHDSAGMDSSRHHEAHVHGIAELLVVLEGGQLDIELHSPAMNLLGFEHRASTTEQQALVKKTMDTLADTNNLFTFGSAQCQLIDHDVNVGHLLDEAVHHDTDSPDKESHDEESHGEGPHDQEHESNHHDGHEEHGHSDIEAHYRYRCEPSNTLDSLTTSIPAVFPGIESLQVQWIANGRQGTVTLDNIRRHLKFQQ